MQYLGRKTLVKKVNKNKSYCPYDGCHFGPNLKDDNCDHVQCPNCKKDFCFYCSCKRNNYLEHGSHYHRRECIFFVPWIDPKTKKEILVDQKMEIKCDECKVLKSNKKKKNLNINYNLYSFNIILGFLV